MPRPLIARAAFGAATVVLSTFVMLLLSGTRTTSGVAVVAAAGLALGVLVALVVPGAVRGGTVGRAAAPAPADPPAAGAAGRLLGSDVRR